MKIFKKVFGAMAALSLILSLSGPITAFAATTPSLGAAATYGVLSSTYTNTTVTTINGDVGFATGPAVAPLGVHTNYGSGAPYSTAGSDQNNALTSLNSQACTFTFAPGAIDLAADTTHGPIGVYTPGVYCTSGAGAASIGTAGITLNGIGTYIFRVNGALTSVANSVVTLSGSASVCDVFWTPTSATTLGATSTFKGTNIDASGITIGSTVNWTGRALAFGGTVSTDTDTITAPTCAAPAPIQATSSANNTITVFKQVINDNGGTLNYTDFPLFINGNPVVSGQSIALAPGIYTVTETNKPNYQASFAGDCNASGQINHGGINTHNDVCTIVNNDIGPAVAAVPPLIHITKIPNPLALPGGSGLVTYNYAVSNIGVVAMTNITVNDNKCGPVTYVSGDTNLNSKLDVNEIWNYKCSATLSQTTNNTVTATGLANGLTATDIANATVVVGSQLPPPLIDLIKIPTPLFLPAAGGLVKYSYLVSNPGIVPINNVTLTDNKCSQILGPSGDLNGNGLLDTNETWTYACQMNLSATTTNTAIAQGSANGFTVTHSSVVTVVVASPKLPNTGFDPKSQDFPWQLTTFVIAGLALLIFSSKRETTVQNGK